MHKDKPPGFFEFGARPISYSVWFGLITGFILSIFVYAGISLSRANAPVLVTPRSNADGLEATMSARRNASPTPTAPPAVRY
jgi:hypothetical protein